MLLYCGRSALSNLCGRGRARFFPIRPLHSGPVASALASNVQEHDSIELPVGVHRSVKLDVSSSREPRKSGGGPRNVLVYLPTGPTIGATTRPSLDAFTLPNHVLPSETSVVRINYRLGSSTPTSPGEFEVFPTPIHEVATALDFLTSSTSRFNENEDEPPKICLLGSHIGGALANMLALTEPNAIHSLAVVEPMVDWVGLDEVRELLRTVGFRSAASPKKTQAQRLAQRQAQKGRKTGQVGEDTKSILAAVDKLIKLRSQLFKTPSGYFDPFASPMLFLRAPGRDTPTGTMGEQTACEMGLDDLDGGYDDTDAFGPYDDDWQRSSTSTVPSTPASRASTSESFSESSMSSSPSATVPPRRRKVLRRWPAVGIPEAVTLPHVRIFVQALSQSDTEGPPAEEFEAIDIAEGHAALMRAQGTEMVELMRRACFIGREKSFAEGRVKLELCGAGLRSGEAANMEKAAVNWLSRRSTNTNDED